MKVHFLSLLIILFSQSILAGSVEPYQLPILRDGQTYKMVAYNFWSGEYPGPVINVTKNMQIEGYQSLRDKAVIQSCKIDKGLYHPWGESPSLILFYTITDVLGYEVTQDVLVDEMVPDKNPIEFSMNLKAGDQIDNVVYLSEGWCRGKLTSEENGDQFVDFFCSNLSDAAGVMEKSNSNPFGRNEQWLYMKCADGSKVFVEDAALLNMPGVKEGQITGFGEISE